MSNILNKLYSIIVDVPFKNCFEDHHLYDSGELQRMTKQQKIDYIIKKCDKNQHFKLFSRVIRIRPSVMDDHDVAEFNALRKEDRKHRAIILSGLFANWSWIAYSILVKRKQSAVIFGTFVGINLFFILYHMRITRRTDKFLYEMMDKYKDVIRYDDLKEVMKQAYNID